MEAIQVLTEQVAGLKKVEYFPLFQRFLGKVLSQYVSLCVINGKGDKMLFSADFDYERWKKTYTKAKVRVRSPLALFIF